MRRLWLLPALWLAAHPARAAQEFQLWLESGLEVELAKRWRLELEQHLRFDRNLTAVDEIMPQVSVSFRPLRFLHLGLGYRFVTEPIESREATYVEVWHRIFADLQLRLRLKPLVLRYRLRYQEQFGWTWRNGERYLARHTFRNRLGLEARMLPWLRPTLAGELFVRVGDPDGLLHKWRLSVGIDFVLSAHTLELCYRLEDLVADSNDPTRHILGLGYRYAF
jgi:hypothetical protein